MTQGGSTQVMKGKVDMIEMTLGKRSGNKKVTLIHNLDVYGIDPKDFGHKCQVGVAASSTVNEAANKKKSNGQPVIEVLVQGNQVAFAAKLLLEHYKIPKKYIRGLNWQLNLRNDEINSGIISMCFGEKLILWVSKEN